MELVWFKIIAVVVLLTFGFIGGLAPYYCVKLFSKTGQKKFLSIATCFAGGVFLSVALLHMLPEAIDDINELTESHDEEEGGEAYPLACLFAGIGYLIILASEHAHGGLSEEDAMMAHAHGHSHAHTQDDTAYGAAQTPYVAINDKESGDHLNEPLLADKAANKKQFQAILLLVALSIHAVIEGIAVGVQQGTDAFLVVFFAIAAHKSTEAFALGSKHVDAGYPKKRFFATMISFSFATPLGIILGLAMTEIAQGATVMWITGICTAVAAGTFLQIAGATFAGEVEGGEVQVSSLGKFTGIAIGFTIMAVVAIWT